MSSQVIGKVIAYRKGLIEHTIIPGILVVTCIHKGIKASALDRFHDIDSRKRPSVDRFPAIILDRSIGNGELVIFISSQRTVKFSRERKEIIIDRVTGVAERHTVRTDTGTVHGYFTSAAIAVDRIINAVLCIIIAEHQFMSLINVPVEAHKSPVGFLTTGEICP